jgi:N-ethylmaleimide reductase
MSDSDPRGTFTAAAAALAPLGLAYLHVIEPVGEEGEERITPSLRGAFGGTLILNGGYDRTLGDAALASNEADLISYGSLFLANPDLPQRFAAAAPLNAPQPATFYTGGERGYIDYPAWNPAAMAA